MKSIRKSLAMVLSLAMVVALLLGSTVLAFADEPTGSSAATSEESAPETGDVFKLEDWYIVGTWESDAEDVEIYINGELYDSTEVDFPINYGITTIDVYESGRHVYTQTFELPAPINVTGLTVSPEVVKPGDKLTISAEVDKPELLEHLYVEFSGPDDERVSVLMSDGEKSATYEIHDGKLNGEYKLYYFEVYTPEEALPIFDVSAFPISFTISGSLEDKEPPTGDVTLNAKKFTAGDTIKVTANVKDNLKMGYIEAYAYQVTDPDAEYFSDRYVRGYKQEIEMTLLGEGAPEDGGTYEGSIKVTDEWPSGDYDVAIIGYDKVFNDDIVGTFRFSVGASKSDAAETKPSDGSKADAAPTAPSKSDSNASGASKPATGVPKTGDAETLMLWVVIIGASTIAAAATIAMTKVRNAR